MALLDPSPALPGQKQPAEARTNDRPSTVFVFLLAVLTFVISFSAALLAGRSREEAAGRPLRKSIHLAGHAALVRRSAAEWAQTTAAAESQMQTDRDTAEAAAREKGKNLDAQALKNTQAIEELKQTRKNIAVLQDKQKNTQGSMVATWTAKKERLGSLQTEAKDVYDWLAKLATGQALPADLPSAAKDWPVELGKTNDSALRARDNLGKARIALNDALIKLKGPRNPSTTPTNEELAKYRELPGQLTVAKGTFDKEAKIAADAMAPQLASYRDALKAAGAALEPR